MLVRDSHGVQLADGIRTRDGHLGKQSALIVANERRPVRLNHLRAHAGAIRQHVSVGHGTVRRGLTRAHGGRDASDIGGVDEVTTLLDDIVLEHRSRAVQLGRRYRARCRIGPAQNGTQQRAAGAIIGVAA